MYIKPRPEGIFSALKNCHPQKRSYFFSKDSFFWTDSPLKSNTTVAISKCRKKIAAGHRWVAIRIILLNKTKLVAACHGAYCSELLHQRVGLSHLSLSHLVDPIIIMPLSNRRETKVLQPTLTFWQDYLLLQSFTIFNRELKQDVRTVMHVNNLIESICWSPFLSIHHQ